MGFFHSPMKLIGLVKDSASIASKLNKGFDADWFFSKEGEKAYKNAKTPAQKTMFYFNYLLALTKNVQANRDVIYRIAYVLQDSVEGSSLEYAEYPAILDSTKNPIINAIKTKNLNVSCTNGDYSIYGILFLSAIHRELDVEKFLKAEHKPYTRITYCEKDGDASDMYKLERTIIGAFCNDSPRQYMPPYTYSITDSVDTGDDECVDDEE